MNFPYSGEFMRYICVKAQGHPEAHGKTQTKQELA
jgi:hypothetical protein